jgi:hypothetical protein
MVMAQFPRSVSTATSRISIPRTGVLEPRAWKRGKKNPGHGEANDMTRRKKLHGCGKNQRSCCKKQYD